MILSEHNAYLAGFKDCQRKAKQIIETRAGKKIEGKKYLSIQNVLLLLSILAPEEKEKENEK